MNWFPLNVQNDPQQPQLSEGFKAHVQLRAPHPHPHPISGTQAAWTWSQPTVGRSWGQAPRSRQGLEHPEAGQSPGGVQGEPSSAGPVGGKGLDGATLAPRC